MGGSQNVNLPFPTSKAGEVNLWRSKIGFDYKGITFSIWSRESSSSSVSYSSNSLGIKNMFIFFFNDFLYALSISKIVKTLIPSVSEFSKV